MSKCIPTKNVINLELTIKKNSLTPNHSLLYNFDTRQTEPDTISRVSVWGIHIINTFLDQLRAAHKMTNDQYIIGPYYRDYNDLQVGITGKIKYGETKKDAALREIEEEIGYRINDEDLVFVGDTVKNRESWSVYAANVTTLKPLIRSVKPDGKKDDHRIRVLILLHGTKSEIMDLFNKEFNMRKSEEKAQIQGIGMITLNTVGKIIETNSQVKKLGYYDINFL